MSVCKVVSAPYVGDVPVMRVLVFVLHVCMLKECEGDANAGVGDWEGVIVVSTIMSMRVVHVVHVLSLAQLTC